MHADHLRGLGEEAQHDPGKGVILSRTVRANDAFVKMTAEEWVPVCPVAHSHDIDGDCTPSEFMQYVNSIITVDDVKRAIAKGRDASASGIDGISYIILKLMDDDDILKLVALFNSCLATGTTPK